MISAALFLRSIGRVAQQLQHLCDVRLVPAAMVLRLRVVPEVVVAIRQPKAALVEARDLLLRVVRVLLGARVEQDAAARGLALEPRQQWREVLVDFAAAIASSSVLSGEAPSLSARASSMHAA